MREQLERDLLLSPKEITKALSFWEKMKRIAWSHRNRELESWYRAKAYYWEKVLEVKRKND